jgi:NAD(P)-dependent dehydrogenase (short-subunit alcohol dehydrogenase family)
MGWLDDQVVLVTGGGSGSGRAVVARFVEEGARVGVMERVAARAEQLSAEFGDAVVGVSGDVSRIDDNRRAVAETVSAFGRLDVFIGNAGVFDVFASFTDLSDDKLNEACDELFGVNVKGCLFGAKAALPELRKTGGSMIFTASIAGLNSGGGGVLYTASKHAVVGMIRQLAAELGLDIREQRGARRHTDDLRGLVSLGEDGRSHFANPASRADRIQQSAADARCRTMAGAYVFLASRRNARGITGSIVTVDARVLAVAQLVTRTTWRSSARAVALRPGPVNRHRATLPRCVVTAAVDDRVGWSCYRHLVSWRSDWSSWLLWQSCKSGG